MRPRPELTWRGEDVALLVQYLDDGQYFVYLNRDEGNPRRVQAAMESAWVELACGDRSRPLWRTRVGSREEGRMPYRAIECCPRRVTSGPTMNVWAGGR